MAAGQQVVAPRPTPKPAAPKVPARVKPAPVTKTVRAFPFRGRDELTLPAGWIPFAADQFVVFAYKELHARPARSD